MSRSTNARGAGKANTSSPAVVNDSSFEGSALSNVLDENVRLMQQLRSEFKEMEMLKLVAERRRDVYAIVEEEHAAKLAAVPLPQPVPAGALPTDPSTDQLQTALSSLQQLYVHYEPNHSSPRSVARALQEVQPGSPHTPAHDRLQHSGRPLGPPHSDLGSPGLSSSSSVLDAVQTEVASLERDGLHGSLRDSVRARRNTEGDSRRAQALLDLTVQQSAHAAVRARAGVDRSSARLDQAMQGGAAARSRSPEQLPLYQALPPMSPSAWLAEPVLFGAASAALSSPGPSRSEVTLALTQTPSAQAHAQEQGRAAHGGLTFAKALAEAEAARARGDAPVLLAPSLAARGLGNEEAGDRSTGHGRAEAQAQGQGQAQVEAGDASQHTSSRPKRAAPSAREAQKKEILAQLFAAADASAAEEAAQERAVAEARALGAGAGVADAGLVPAPLVSSPTAGSSSSSSRVRDVSELRALSRSAGSRATASSASSSSSAAAAAPTEASSPSPSASSAPAPSSSDRPPSHAMGLLMSPVQAIILSKLPQPARAPPAPGEGRRAAAAAPISAAEGTVLSPEWEALLHDLESAAGAWKQGLEGQGGAEAAPAPAEALVEAPVEAGSTADTPAAPPAPGPAPGPAQAAVSAGVGAGTGALVSSSPFAARIAAARAAKGGLPSLSPLPRAPLRATPAYAGPIAPVPAGASFSVSLTGGDSSPRPSSAPSSFVYAADGVAVRRSSTTAGLGEEGDGATAVATATTERDPVGEDAATEAVPALAAGMPSPSSHAQAPPSAASGGLYPHEEAGVWTGRDSPALEWLEPVPPSQPQASGGRVGGLSVVAGGGSASGALEARRDLINSVRKGPKAWRSPRSAPTSPLLASPGALLSFIVGSGAGAGAGAGCVTSPTAALLSAGARIARERGERERQAKEREAAAAAQAAEAAGQQGQRAHAESVVQKEERGERQRSPAVEQRLAFTLHAAPPPPPAPARVDPRPSLLGIGMGMGKGEGGQQEEEEEEEAAAAPVATEPSPYQLHSGGDGLLVLASAPPALTRPPSPGSSRRALRRADSARGAAVQFDEEEEVEGQDRQSDGGPSSMHEQQQQQRQLEEIGADRTVPAVGLGGSSLKKRRGFLPSLFWLCSGVTSVERGPGRSGKAVGHASHVAQERSERRARAHGGTSTGTAPVSPLNAT